MDVPLPLDDILQALLVEATRSHVRNCIRQTAAERSSELLEDWNKAYAPESWGRTFGSPFLAPWDIRMDLHNDYLAMRHHIKWRHAYIAQRLAVLSQELACCSDAIKIHQQNGTPQNKIMHNLARVHSTEDAYASPDFLLVPPPTLMPSDAFLSKKPAIMTYQKVPIKVEVEKTRVRLPAYLFGMASATEDSAEDREHKKRRSTTVIQVQVPGSVALSSLKPSSVTRVGVVQQDLPLDLFEPPEDDTSTTASVSTPLASSSASAFEHGRKRSRSQVDTPAFTELDGFAWAEALLNDSFINNSPRPNVTIHNVDSVTSMDVTQSIQSIESHSSSSSIAPNNHCDSSESLELPSSCSLQTTTSLHISRLQPHEEEETDDEEREVRRLAYHVRMEHKERAAWSGIGDTEPKRRRREGRNTTSTSDSNQGKGKGTGTGKEKERDKEAREKERERERDGKRRTHESKTVYWEAKRVAQALHSALDGTSMVLLP
jgi:hypothetical protein